MPDLKTCSVCGQDKPRSEFHRATAARDGLQSTCKPCRAVQVKRWAQANFERRRESRRRLQRENREAYRALHLRWAGAVRTQVFGYYGTACVCCGCTDDLSIDHVNGDGRQHRQELFGKNQAGVQFYAWLIRQGFPEGYQTLCRRCNTSKGTGERCLMGH